LVVCNDSGLMHLAAAAGANVVALFGSTDPDATGPFSESAVVIRGEAPCAPCFLRDCPTELECFDDVTVDVVLAECGRILEGSG
ncbi:MAG: glycosyltransferase family 9 protein, partial [bacterium]